MHPNPYEATLGRLKTHPEIFPRLPAREFYSIPWPLLREIQLSAAQQRFSSLLTRIPMLTQLAEEQRIDQIRRLEDLAPLLVPHSAFKSYPLSIVENNQFDRLTRWLGSFTTVDLSAVDASACDSIDSWIDLLDAKTPIRLAHSGGTTGKLSFLARTEAELREIQIPYIERVFEGFGEDPGRDSTGFDRMPFVYPGYRRGAMGHIRYMEVVEKFLHRGQGTPIVTLFPGRLSADALSFGGRLAAAEAQGERGTLKLSASLLKRREEMIKEREQSAGRFDAFVDALVALKGQRVFMAAFDPQFHDIAVAGLKRGVEHCFAPDSLFLVSGGKKGRDLPVGWEDTVNRFLGGPLMHGYGMGEGMGMAPLCRAGFYHYQPWIVPFLLNPTSGELLPSTGHATGRLGIFDLAAYTTWGGALSGDRVTIDWGDERPCSCGRVGPYIDQQITRYSELEGGDDKITCAGAPHAHDKALDFILQHMD